MDLNTDPASSDPSTAWPKASQHSVVIKQASQADISYEERAAAIYMAKRASNTATAYAIAAEKAKFMPRAIIAAVRAQEAAAKAAAAWAVVESLSATSQPLSHRTNENETPAPSPNTQKASTALMQPRADLKTPATLKERVKHAEAAHRAHDVTITDTTCITDEEHEEMDAEEEQDEMEDGKPDESGEVRYEQIGGRN